VQVDQPDRGCFVVAGAVVSGSFDAVGVVAGSLDDPWVGPVPAPGFRCFALVMSAMTLARMRSCCSGGKGRRVGGPAADDADGPLELDPVRVNGRFGGGPADQRR
jgi:hypothetical protein